MSNSSRFISQSNKQAFRNPWVLGWLGILFLVLVVNAAFITTAFMTNPGLVEEDYYEKGKNHEQTVRTKIANRKRLSWDIDLRLDKKLITNRATTIHVNIMDKHGRALDNSKVTLSAYRPSDIHADFSRIMVNITPGRFVITVKFPLKGVWDLKATVQSGKDMMELEQRIQVSAQD